MNKTIFTVIVALAIAVNGNAAETPVQVNAANPLESAETANQEPDINNLEYALPTAQQQVSPQEEYFGRKRDRPVSTHKLNYFSINQIEGNSNAQIKFQISMKFRILEPNLYVLKYNLFPAYVAYTQKSLWNVGQKSMPFEENNYNPEVFLDYPVNSTIYGRLKLRNIVFSPFEHESNGSDGEDTRSWNRLYLLIRFGLESKDKLEVTNSFLSDKASFYVKLWQASDYEDQDKYLQSIGSNDEFLDYMGRGEVGISLRNFLWRGSLKNHQLDIKTPIFREEDKHSYQVEFRQQIPYMNFALYTQYWYGYGETLMRFDQFGHRGFIGLTFSY